MDSIPDLELPHDVIFRVAVGEMEGCERGGSQFWFQGVVFWIALSQSHLHFIVGTPAVLVSTVVVVDSHLHWRVGSSV